MSKLVSVPVRLTPYAVDALRSHCPCFYGLLCRDNPVVWLVLADPRRVTIAMPDSETSQAEVTFLCPEKYRDLFFCPTTNQAVSEKVRGWLCDSFERALKTAGLKHPFHFPREGIYSGEDRIQPVQKGHPQGR
jgi:hypothetical protein